MAITNPQFSAAIAANYSGGTAPAIVSAVITDSTTAAPTVGTGTNNANSITSKTISVASGTPVTLDLTSATDPIGGSINFAKVRSVKLTNNGTTGQTITYGGGSNEIFAAAADALQALGGVHAYDFPDGGLTVDSTHKNIIFTCATGTTSVVYTIIGHT